VVLDQSQEDKQRKMALEDYAKALSLVHRLRATAAAAHHQKVRHWAVSVNEVSGDFFCSAEHPRFGWFGLFADTSGHGLSSVIFSLHLPVLFREAVVQGHSLATIHALLNRSLLQLQLTGHFVCSALVRVRKRRIEIINAGMPDVLLLTTDGRLAEAFPSKCLPLGIDGGTGGEDITIQRYQLAGSESAALLLYSDGLTELGILNGAAFGSAGVMDAASRGTDVVFDRLVAAIEARSAEIHDDITLALVPVPIHPAVAGANDAVPDPVSEEKRKTAAERL